MTLNNTNFDQLLDDAKEYLHYFIDNKWDVMQALQLFREKKILVIPHRPIPEGANRHYIRMMVHQQCKFFKENNIQVPHKEWSLEAYNEYLKKQWPDGPPQPLYAKP